MRRLWQWWQDFRVMVRGMNRLRSINAPEPMIRACWSPLRPRRSMAFQWETMAQTAIRFEQMALRMGTALGRKPAVESDRFVRAKLEPEGPYR